MSYTYKRSCGKFFSACRKCGKSPSELALIMKDAGVYTSGKYYCLNCNQWLWKIEEIKISVDINFDEVLGENPNLIDFMKNALNLDVETVQLTLVYQEKTKHFAMLIGNFTFKGNPDEIYATLTNNPIVLSQSMAIPLEICQVKNPAEKFKKMIKRIGW